MNKQEYDLTLVDRIRRLFKKKDIINKDDLGIYHYLWSCDTLTKDAYGLRYDVFAKIKVVETYSELVEVEMINLKINDSASQDVINIISNNFPKYINPKNVNWIIKN